MLQKIGLCTVVIGILMLSRAWSWHSSNYFGKMRSLRSVRTSMHFEEAGTGSTIGLLDGKRYIATNRFNVRPNKEPTFEKRWATRKSRLAKLDGFRFFTLLKKKSVIMGGDSNDKDNDPNYVSFTIWENKDNFDAWRTGEAFKEAHGGGGIMDFVQLLSTALFILNGKPKPAFYDALLPQISSFSNADLGIQPNENGWRDFGDLTGEQCLPADLIVVQDKFAVKDKSRPDFEEVWSSRESALKGYSGFVGFFLQRRDALKSDDNFNYIATTMWKDMASFEMFKEAMMNTAAQGSSGKTTTHMLLQPPRIVVYEGKLALQAPAGP